LLNSILKKEGGAIVFNGFEKKKEEEVDESYWRKVLFIKAPKIQRKLGEKMDGLAIITNAAKKDRYMGQSVGKIIKILTNEAFGYESFPGIYAPYITEDGESENRRGQRNTINLKLIVSNDPEILELQQITSLHQLEEAKKKFLKSSWRANQQRLNALSAEAR
jgi:hypothetical protein